VSTAAQASKTILLLGAGASKASDFRLPTMRGFFDLAQVPENLKEFLKIFYPAMLVEEFDLEEVLTHLTLSVRRLPSWIPDERVQHSIGVHYPLGDLLWYVGRRLAIDPTKICSRHAALFRRLEARDSVLTLNYDLVADQALSVLDRDPNDEARFRRFSRMDKLADLVGDARLLGGEPMALLPEEHEGGFYLKLHGSLDWLYCPNTGCPNWKRFYPLSGERIKEGQKAGSPCRLCGSIIRSVIVAPLPEKAQVFEGRFGILWNLALRELQQATRIVVIGVSLARSDFELSWLIRLSGMTRFHKLDLVVVNPNESDRAAARRLFGTSRLGTNVEEFEDVDEFLGQHSDMPS